jgi:hypothetical protein
MSTFVSDHAFVNVPPHCHSGAMRSIEPGISRFPDVQLHIRGSMLRIAPE